MFRIEMLPAGEGDCLWIEYGERERPHRILIDTGTSGTYPALQERIRKVGGPCRFELFVVTHIDEDHIGSAVKLMEDPPEGVSFGDIWFNGYRHLLKATDRLGVKKAQELTLKLDRDELPWNNAFGGGPVMVNETGDLAPVTIDDTEMKLTVLSPYRQQLEDLLEIWENTLRDFLENRPGLVDDVAADHLGGKIDVKTLAEEDFIEDTKKPNGSSIALLLEYGGKRVLLGADAFPTVLERSIRRVTGGGKLDVDAFKVCHHGSKKNTSKELVELLDARAYLISTDGNRHDHPDQEGIARLIWYGAKKPVLWFNYETTFTRPWGGGLTRKHDYRVEFPSSGEGGVVLDFI